MNDAMGILIMGCLLFVALLILFLCKNLKWQGFWVVVICSLIVIVPMRDRIAELVITRAGITVRLREVETRLNDIAEAMETLLIAQRIDKLSERNCILLDYEPVPESITIIVGPLVNFPRPSYGYRLEGRRIYIVDPNTLKRITNRLPSAVTVQYLRRVKATDIIK